MRVEAGTAVADIAAADIAAARTAAAEPAVERIEAEAAAASSVERRIQARVAATEPPDAFPEWVQRRRQAQRPEPRPVRRSMGNRSSMEERRVRIADKSS